MTIEKTKAAADLNGKLFHLENELKRMEEIKNNPTAISFFKERYTEDSKTELFIQNTTHCSNNEYLKRAVDRTYKVFMTELRMEIQICKSDIEKL